MCRLEGFKITGCGSEARNDDDEHSVCGDASSRHLEHFAGHSAITSAGINASKLRHHAIFDVVAIAASRHRLSKGVVGCDEVAQRAALQRLSDTRYVVQRQEGRLGSSVVSSASGTRRARGRLGRCAYLNGRLRTQGRQECRWALVISPTSRGAGIGSRGLRRRSGGCAGGRPGVPPGRYRAAGCCWPGSVLHRRTTG